MHLAAGMSRCFGGKQQRPNVASCLLTGVLPSMPIGSSITDSGFVATYDLLDSGACCAYPSLHSFKCIF